MTDSTPTPQSRRTAAAQEAGRLGGIPGIPAHILDLAATIANQAEALAAGTITASPHAVALLIKSNAETLAAWTGQAEMAQDR